MPIGQILTVLFVLIIIGVLLWMFNNFLPAIDVKLKKIINVVVILFVILWLLNVFIGFVPHGRVPGCTILWG